MEDNILSVAYVRGPGDRGRRMDPRAILFSDGSHMIVTPDTSIDCDYGTDRRRLTLKCGSAVFTALYSAKRPFEVSVGPILVRALQGEFEVSFNEDDEVITVRTVYATVEVLVPRPPAVPESDAPLCRRVLLESCQLAQFHPDGTWTMRQL